jgi:hypothetical protein
MDDSGALRDLNRRTFLAEEQQAIDGVEWSAFLMRVLAPEFVLRRGNPQVANQTREEMIAWIPTHPTSGRVVKDGEAKIWATDALGVVTCPVEMTRDGALRRYQNIKVFTRKSPSEWQCVYWQVTESPTK